MNYLANFFKEFLEFSKPHSAATKFLNVMAVFTMNIFWLIFVFVVLGFVFGLGNNDIVKLIQSSITVQLVQGASADANPWSSYILVFFLACILAPLWEEWCFRHAPIRFAQVLSGVASYYGIKRGLVGAVAIAFAIFFGILHGSAMNILFQGVTGMLFCWLYLKNNDSYWSVVIAHAVWNYMVIFGLPFVMGV